MPSQAPKSPTPLSSTTGENTKSPPAQGDVGAGNSAALDAAGLSAAPPTDALDAQERARIDALKVRLSSERGAIKSAASFTAIADVIDRSASPKKGEAAIKLRNTDRGVQRAQDYFKQNGMADEEKAFITDRYADALDDQRTGIAETAKSGGALAQILGRPDPELVEADYSTLQWDAVFGANKEKTLKQELMSPDDMEASVKVAQSRGGLAKLIGLGNLWKAMDPALRSLWAKSNGNNEDAAKAAWIAQTKSKKEPAIVPIAMGPVPAADYAAFSSLAKAFSADTDGCMGMGEDYKFDSLKSACDALGLQEAWYQDGAFILSIPGGEVEAAVDAAKAKGGGVGKATVFTSLMFSEFNYIVEDRATNETESGDSKVNPNAKQNSGTKSAGGKTEVVVTKLPASAILASKPKFLG